MHLSGLFRYTILFSHGNAADIGGMAPLMVRNTVCLVDTLLLVCDYTPACCVVAPHRAGWLAGWLLTSTSTITTTSAGSSAHTGRTRATLLHCAGALGGQFELLHVCLRLFRIRAQLRQNQGDESVP